MDTLAWTPVAYPNWYLKIYQDEADLGVKEKADKPKGIILQIQERGEDARSSQQQRFRTQLQKSLLFADGKDMPCCTEKPASDLLSVF